VLEIVRGTRFKRDYKRAEKRGKDITRLQALILLLAEEKRYQRVIRTILSAANGSIIAIFTSSRTGC
jgi:mRNA-degrading endonuclease YafQ of YafQ-DinJ toxin-antitoxin module